MLKFLGLIIIAFSPLVRSGSIVSLANVEKPSKNRFCEARQSKQGILKILRQEENHISFNNEGGLFGLRTGVCWWHSRLQRRMSYLADFRPDLPRPIDREVRQILRKIKRGNKVVTVPGYKNLEEFSYENNEIMQRSLNAWMLGDSLLRQRWMLGLKGKTKLTPSQFKEHLDQMVSEFARAQGPQFQVLQMSGLTAHSWLLLGLRKINDDKYEIEIIDSNDSKLALKYHVVPSTGGMLPVGKIVKTSVGSASADFVTLEWLYSSFVSYTQFDKELKTLTSAVAKHCADPKTNQSKTVNRNNDENI